MGRKFEHTLSTRSSPALKRLSLKYRKKNAFCTKHIFSPRAKVFICSTINVFIIYLEGDSENLRKRMETREKKVALKLAPYPGGWETGLSEQNYT